MIGMPDLKPLLLAWGVLVLPLLPMSADARCMMGSHCMGMMGGHSARHGYYMRHGLPSGYADKTNPLSATDRNLREGKQLYQQNCAACHGASGRGDGPNAASLDPPAADLARTLRMPMATDAYLYWAIAEGGAQFHTAMPSWKGSLKQEQIWQLVLHLRTL